MALTKEQVSHVAKLAELALSDDELNALSVDLAAILRHVDELQSLDLTGTNATAHLAVARMPLRPDEPTPGIDNATALRSAPKELAFGFAVPAFVEDK